MPMAHISHNFKALKLPSTERQKLSRGKEKKKKKNSNLTLLNFLFSQNPISLYKSTKSNIVI